MLFRSPTITGTTPNSNCGSGTVVLGATSSAGTVNWYAAATGGTALGTGNSYTTPVISVNTTYWVDATISGCTTTSRTSVLASINTTPTITNVFPSSHCGPGTVVLSATASAGTINWYDVPTGGTSLAVNTVFTTPTLSVTDTFYVDATIGNCPSSTRTIVIASIKPIPPTPTGTGGNNCGTGTVGLTASATSGTVTWYNASTGGSPLGTGPGYTTASISATTTYYIEAVLNGCPSAPRIPVVATITTMPSITATTPDTVCGPASATLVATPSHGTVSWFASATGGTALGTGNSYNTPNLTVNTTFYASVTDSGCTSARTGVLAKVDSAAVPGAVHAATAPLDTINVGGNTGTLSLTGYVGSIVQWERNTNGGTFNALAGTSNLTSYNEVLSAVGDYIYRVKIQRGICPAVYSTGDTIFVRILGIEELENNKLFIYSYDKNIYIKNPTTEKISEVIVYNLAGEEVKRLVPENNSLVEIPMHVATSNYVVKVVTKKQAYSTKIFLK